MRPMRAVADVASLPTTTFGNRGILWWGTLGFIVIEGSTLAICALTYFYLRKNFYTWPPQFIPSGQKQSLASALQPGTVFTMTSSCPSR